MSIASILGFGGGKVRYAIVGLGDIAQEAMMPGVGHTGNSEMVALVSGDRTKLGALGERYGVGRLVGYDDYPALIASGDVDAVYIATPNWRHAEFAIPALEAGIHVLCEKPLEISAALCRAMIAAAERGGAKLMTAYRLHFEPATLDAIRRVRAGEIGEIVSFASVFAQMVDPANHRARHGVEAGPLFDMAPYPINALRALFGAEPVEVISAVGVRHADAGLGDLDDTVSVSLRMPNGAVAQFAVSYYGDGAGSLDLVGTKGTIRLDPAYTFGEPLVQHRRIGGERTREAFRATDQFGGQMRYFSNCILKDRPVEPDGEEGLADLLVIEAIVAAMRSGGGAPIEPLDRRGRIDPDAQLETLRPIATPEPVRASDPVRD